MIFDAHVHLVGPGWLHERFFDGIGRVFAVGTELDPAAVTKQLREFVIDPTGERLISEMDAASIDRSCVFALDYGLLTGEPATSIEEQNQVVARVVRRFSDRLIGFCSVDPRRPEALDLFRRSVEDWGFSGLKLHPASGWFPHDEAFYPLYEQCSHYGLPLLIHTGGQPGPMKSRCGQPIYIDDVAGLFPELNIIMAHCGYGWWEEALMVGSMKPNCYVDFSGWQGMFLTNPTHFYTVLRRALDVLGPHRVLFGTDGPYLNGACPVDKWVDAFRTPAAAPSCMDFSSEEMTAVLGPNFQRLVDGTTSQT